MKYENKLNSAQQNESLLNFQLYFISSSTGFSVTRKNTLIKKKQHIEATATTK